MQYTFVPIVIAVFFFTSCKKDSGAPIDPGNPNNELRATVTVVGEATALHHANGSRTSFVRRIDLNGDTIVTVSGSIGEYGTASSRKIEIWLVNISGPGSYDLTYDLNSNPRQKSWSVYIVGDIFFSTIFELYVSYRSTTPGKVTIDLLTAKEIRGSFTTKCSNSQLLNAGTDYAQITNGFFKGSF